MPFDAGQTPTLSDQIAIREQLKARIRESQKLVVPEHLKGTLYSPRDCFESTLAEAHKGLERFFPSLRKEGE
jgi:hypothetical protein